MSITIFKLNENEEYEQIMQLPTLPMCMFMKTIYKRFFYEEISQYSNLPHYDVCPVPAGSYDIKQYPFNMNKFERVEEALGAGSYRMNCFLIHNDVAVSGSLFYGSITEKAWNVLSFFFCLHVCMCFFFCFNLGSGTLFKIESFIVSHSICMLCVCRRKCHFWNKIVKYKCVAKVLTVFSINASKYKMYQRQQEHFAFFIIS